GKRERPDRGGAVVEELQGDVTGGISHDARVVELDGGEGKTGGAFQGANPRIDRDQVDLHGGRLKDVRHATARAGRRIDATQIRPGDAVEDSAFLGDDDVRDDRVVHIVADI